MSNNSAVSVSRGHVLQKNAVGSFNQRDPNGAFAKLPAAIAIR